MKSFRAAIVRCALVAAVVLASEVAAQAPPASAPIPGRIRGTVVADSGGTPVVDAEVSLPGTDRKVRTDTAGRYDFPNLTAGSTLVQVRAVGFRPETTTIEVRDRRVVQLQLRLAFEEIAVVRRGAAQALPKVTTEAIAPDARGRMEEFYSRRQMGIGRFIDRETLAKWENRKTGDLFATVGSVQVKTGGLRSWISNGRANDASCAFCSSKNVFSIVSEADFSAGARPACYMDVWLDGARMYQFGLEPPQPLFDVNSVAPETLEGIEVYAGVAQIPAKYNSQLSSGCGVVLLWTRISPDRKP